MRQIERHMVEKDPDIRGISDSLINEIVNAAGLPKTAAVQCAFRHLFHRATERLAGIGVSSDRLLTETSFQEAASWMYSNFCREVRLHGQENLPAEGPLLIVSNHAGTYDSIVLASHIGREDLKVMANDLLFFRELPHIARHVIFLSDNMADRVAATRAGIRHLQSGGAFLLFGTGRIDPDPAVFPHAEGYIERWSPSIELFLRSVPETQVVFAIVSGVLSKKWGTHPLTWLRRSDWERRRLAEFGQVLQQLFFPGSLYLSPRVSFAAPVAVGTLREESPDYSLLTAVIQHGKALFEEHCQRFDISMEP